MRRRDLALVPVALLAAPLTSRVAAQGEPEDAIAFEQIVDIAYGEMESQGETVPLLLDVYQPVDRGTPRPAVVLIHGGGLQIGDRTFLAAHAEGLAAAGYVAVNIEYRLSTPEDPANVWPAMLDDAQRAVRWVRANADEYGVDPDRVCSYGHSAGGTLAALLGVRDTREGADIDPALEEFSSRTNLIVALAGAMDFTLPEYASQFAVVMGDTFESSPDPYHDASAVEFVDDESAPALLIHGIEDIDVPVAHSRDLAAALEDAGVEVELVEIPDAYHDTTNDWAVVGEYVLPFLERQLQPGR